MLYLCAIAIVLIFFFFCKNALRLMNRTYFELIKDEVKKQIESEQEIEVMKGDVPNE